VDKVRKVYVIPEGALGEAKDPDALVRSKGLEAFREVLKKARPWPLHLADHLLEGVTPEREDRAKSEAVDRVLNMAARPDVDQVREELVYRLASERTGYTVEGLKSVGLSVRERRERDEAEGELKAAAGELVDELGKPGADPFTLAAAFSKRFAVVRGRDDDTPPPFDPDALFDELATMPEGLLSGWKNVDAMDVRFRPQELAVLAARTGHGKTSALVHLLHAWLSADLAGPIVFYSHEEPCNSVNCRLLALLTCTENLTDGLGTSWTTDGVRKYGLNPSARQGDNATAALDRARARLRALKDRLVLVNKPRWSAERIAAHLHELAAEQKAGAVLVDYLQRLPFDGSADRRDIEVSKIAREMKSLAVDLSVPVVMGAQINREAIPKNYRDDITRALDGAEGVHGALKKMKAARPELHHLREGGSEQEADLVLGLMNYAADFHTDEDGKGGKGEDVLTNRFEVGVLKNRYGRTGRWAAMSFLPGRGLFTDLAARDKIGGQ
jgi:replicative DNA helicase